MQGKVLTHKCLHCDASQLLCVDSNSPRNTWTSLDFVSGWSKKLSVFLLFFFSFSFAKDYGLILRLGMQ